ncbi:MAG: DEAD/DEAH box helicase [Phycisphaerae bacterium]|nr:DEAD/DEAH box helicase [Phycisphaerae bacterium]
MSTDYHAKYFAYDLTRQGGKGIDRLSQSLFDACVDLNPHQVEAAVFALRSPLSKGALLADEVGLGKTIEAGLVLSQYWAERKRNLLVVCPASLRKQWQIELEDKFNLPCTVVDSKLYRKAQKDGNPNPFSTKQIVITSLHYASCMAADIRQVQWDLVVIDEAHKLRNSYRASNKIGQNIRWALEDRRKLLLTATPLQNSLTELYGITTLIDDQLFGDLPTFRTLYANSDGDLEDLRARLNGFCKRTLRREVLEFVQYTERKLTTIRFRPNDEEHRLYESVSAFLQREGTYALPKQQKHLTVVVVRKVLASSPVALAGTLEVIRQRLIGLRDQAVDTQDMTSILLGQDDLDEDLIEELLEEMEEETEESQSDEEDEVIDKDKLEAEIQEIDQYIRWARSIGIDTKTRHLLKGLEIGYEKMAAMGALQKAVVFTESRRTQQYLKNFLESNGYAGQVVTFSGSNTDPQSTQIYQKWLDKNQDTGKISGSRAIDMRHAIIDCFEKEAKVMIATEAAAEGINLQFCSLLINFDLPWNPQRVEQRIGRVHRYGQKHDVVVVNFLNERNAADQRVYDLLRHKFNLFEGVFGASDEVLGRLDSSAAFESRILDLYQQCRTPEQIEEGFRRLQQELDEQIQLRLQDTRQKVLEYFDEEVHSRLKVDYDQALQMLDAVGRKFWRLTRFMLDGNARFNEDDLSFYLDTTPVPQLPLGRYHLNRKRDVRIKDSSLDGQVDAENIFLYRLSHPLGEYCIQQAKELMTEAGKVTFDLSGYASKISVLESLKADSGWLILNRLRINSLDEEEYLLFSGFTDTGSNLSHDVLEQLFKLDASAKGPVDVPEGIAERLNADAQVFAQSTLARSLEENNHHFVERQLQLNRWVDDVVAAAERQLDMAKAEIRAARREAAYARTVDEQTAAQENIRVLERKKRAARRQIDEVETQAEEKRDLLIDALRKKMVQNTELSPLFMIRWEMS